MSRRKIKNRIRERRELLVEPFNQKAFIANELKIEKSYISKIEKGERLPNYEIMLRLAEYFDCDVSYLFYSDKKFYTKKYNKYIIPIMSSEERKDRQENINRALLSGDEELLNSRDSFSEEIKRY